MFSASFSFLIISFALLTSPSFGLFCVPRAESHLYQNYFRLFHCFSLYCYLHFHLCCCRTRLVFDHLYFQTAHYFVLIFVQKHHSTVFLILFELNLLLFLFPFLLLFLGFFFGIIIYFHFNGADINICFFCCLTDQHFFFQVKVIVIVLHFNISIVPA